jgi:hypothetical protein
MPQQTHSPAHAMEPRQFNQQPDHSLSKIKASLTLEVRRKE